MLEGMHSTSPACTTISLPSIQNLSAPSRMYVTCSFSWLCSGTTLPFLSRTRASMILSPTIICRSSNGFNCSTSTSFQAMYFSIGFQLNKRGHDQAQNTKTVSTPIHRAAPTTAIKRQLKGLHYRHHLLVRHIDRRLLQQSIAHIGVKQTIVSWESRKCFSRGHAVLRRVECSPVLRFFPAPGIVSRRLAALECFLLRIDSVFHERRLFATNYEAQIGSQRNHAGSKQRARFGIVQYDVESIVDLRTFALDANVRRNRLRSTKQDHGLIDQMDAEIEEDSAARTRSFPPRAGTKLQTITIEVGFVQRNSSKPAAFG